MSNVLIKDIPILDRPRERLYINGENTLSNEELLSIIIKTGTKDKSVKELSNRILKEINDITDLKDLSINKLIEIPGIGKVKAITIKAALELGKRVYENKKSINNKLDSSNKIYEFIKGVLINKKQEYFYALYLDNKKRLIESKLLFIGTLNMSLVHPREVFKYAYILSASTIICVHNHPSGDTLPSKEDYEITKRLVEIGNIQNIKVIDHIIIGDNNYYSFYDNGDI